MILRLRFRLLALAATLLAAAGPARAGDGTWVTLKNNTRQVVVVQETVVCNGLVKRGKAIRLLPGETVREFQAAPAVKKVEIFDGRSPGKLLWSGNLNCSGSAQTFTISSEIKGLTITTPHVVRASGGTEPMPKK